MMARHLYFFSGTFVYDMELFAMPQQFSALTDEIYY